jgi:microcystin-dependent protein
MNNPQVAQIYYPNRLGELIPASVSAVQTGSILPWASTLIPGGYALCDGSQYSRTDPTYSPLYTIIGILYNKPDCPAGYYNVPDCRGTQLVGFGGRANFPDRSGNDTIGTVGGYTRVNLTAEMLPAHDHLEKIATVPPPEFGNPFPSPATIPIKVTGSTDFVIRDQNGNNVAPQQPLIITQPYLTINYIIKL